MSIGGLVAIVVLIVCVVAMLVPAPAWLPYALIAAEAVGILLSRYPLAWSRTP